MDFTCACIWFQDDVIPPAMAFRSLTCASELFCTIGYDEAAQPTPTCGRHQSTSPQLSTKRCRTSSCAAKSSAYRWSVGFSIKSKSGSGGLDDGWKGAPRPLKLLWARRTQEAKMWRQSNNRRKSSPMKFRNEVSFQKKLGWILIYIPALNSTIEK